MEPPLCPTCGQSAAVAAFAMATFFTALIGHAAWWPGHADEARDDEDIALEPVREPV